MNKFDFAATLRPTSFIWNDKIVYVSKISSADGNYYCLTDDDKFVSIPKNEVYDRLCIPHDIPVNQQ